MPRKPVLHWLDTAKAAEMLDASPQWVRELIQRNTFPHMTKIGRFYFIPRQDVENYLRKREGKRRWGRKKENAGNQENQ